MPFPNDPTTARGSASAQVAEQILIMHCLREDSLLGREGYSVRASSCTEQPLHIWALALDQYELPLDMKRGSLLLSQAPRRLAVLQEPGGRVALLHSAYLSEDTMRRPHSFVSHVLVYPRLDALQAAMAWAAPDWQVDEYERGATQRLAPFPGVPRGDLVGEEALTALLSGTSAPADQSLARMTFPSRVERDTSTRRRWLRAALHAFLRTAEPTGSRSRMYVVAEPGVVALLVYAIARLLPPRLAGFFPFSTYEPPHSSMRENKLARVIGSYVRNGLVGSDRDALMRKGYVLDTFRGEFGPDLQFEASTFPLEPMLDLVARGGPDDWKRVDELRSLWENDARVVPGVGPGYLAEAMRPHSQAVELRNGRADVPLVRDMLRNPYGKNLLADPELRRRAWETIRTSWTQPDVQIDCAELLREHTDELLDEIRNRARTDAAGALRGWDALQPLVEPHRLVEVLMRLLEALAASPRPPALSAQQRAGLLRSWLQAAGPTAHVPNALHWLLRTEDMPALLALAREPGLEPRLVALALALALGRSDGWAPGADLFEKLSDEQVHAFVSELVQSPDRDSVLGRLQSVPTLGQSFVDRLLRLQPPLSPSHAGEVLAGLPCDQPDWHPFWLADNRIESLIDLLGTDARLARSLWVGLVSSINPGNFDGVEAGALIETLAPLGPRFRGAADPAAGEQLDAWKTLRDHFHSPPKNPPAELAARLTKACRIVGDENLIDNWFSKHVLTARDNDIERKTRNERLGQALIGFYVNEDNACAAALKLVESKCSDPRFRRYCKEDLFRAIVSEDDWDRLAVRYERELAGTKIEPRVRLREAGPTKKKVSKPGLGVGKLRLPPQATPYAWGLFAGSILTMIPMFVLSPWFADRVDSVSTLWQSSRVKRLQERLKAAEKRSNNFRESFNAQQRQLSSFANHNSTLVAENKNSEAKLANAQAANSDLQKRLEVSESKLRDLMTNQPRGDGHQGSMTYSASNDTLPGTGDSLKVPKERSTQDRVDERKDRFARYRKQLDELRQLVIERPLSEKVVEIDSARRLVDGLKSNEPEIPDEWLSRSDEVFVSCVGPIVKSLRVVAVPRDINSGGEAAEKNTAFAFIYDRSGKSSVLASRSPNDPSKRRFTIDLIKPDEERPWSGRIDASAWTSFAYSSASDYFIGQVQVGSESIHALYSTRSLITALRKIVESKKGKQPPPSAWPYAVRPLPPFAFAAVSDTGSRVALATPQPGKEPSLRGIMWFDVPAPGIEPKFNNLDSTQYKDEPDSGWAISRMTFARGGEKLIVGLQRESGERYETLPLLYSLSGNEPPSRQKKYPGPVIDWALDQNNRLAIITGPNGTINELGGREDEASELTFHYRSDEKPVCVAFSPRGTLLALGDDKGTIWVHSLLGDKHQPPLMLRLKHNEDNRPIAQIGFSPDGRLLGALCRKDTNGKAPHGVIRLWVTDKWDLAGSPPAPTGQ